MKKLIQAAVFSWFVVTATAVWSPTQTVEKAEALVTFDDAKTSVDALSKATSAAGFPSTLKKQ